MFIQFIYSEKATKSPRFFNAKVKCSNTAYTNSKPSFTFVRNIKFFLATVFEFVSAVIAIYFTK